jgi:hypothetical protein
MGNLGYERVNLDLYETPADVANVLTRPPLQQMIARKKVWEPSVGRGALLDALYDAKARYVVASDIHDHGAVENTVLVNMLELEKPLAPVVVTNPPYMLSHEFAEKLLGWIDDGKIETAILLLRATWTHAATRNWMMSHPALAHEVRLSWRPRWIADTTGSPRHDYVWVAWSRLSIGQGGARISYLKRS